MRGSRLGRLAAVALAAGGLILIWAGHVPPAAPDARAILPMDNLLPNASFESGVSHWGGTHVTRVRLGAAAPAGAWVARAEAGSTAKLTLDDWPGAVRATSAGTAYTASAWVASAGGARDASLVVREHRGAEVVASWASAPIAVTDRFQQVTVSTTARRAGDQLDVYAYVPHARAGDALYVDAVALTASYAVPVTNAIGNPSFESASGWVGGHATLRRERTADAPDGAHIGVATWSGTGAYLSIDDWPGTTHTTAGTTYSASALVAGASDRAGRTAQLIVREHTASGAHVGANQSAATPLRRSFTSLRTTYTAQRDGDILDVYVAQPDPQRGDAIAVDAVSLAPIASTLGELALDYDQTEFLGDTSRYAYVVLQESQYPLVAAIHAANPATKVLAYEQVGSVLWQPSCAQDAPEHDAHHPYGVSYCWIQQQNPDWLLTTDGQPATYDGYPHNVMVDVGQPGYQQEWAANVLAEVSTDGFDGVYLDDANAYPGHGRDGTLDQYTDRDYGAAATRFVTAVGDQVRAAGLTVVANVALQPWDDQQAADADAMAEHLDGVTKEFFSHFEPACSAQYGVPFTDPATGDDPDLQTLLNYARSVQRSGAGFLGIDYNGAGDAWRMTYGRAAFLLAWDGRPGSAYLNRPAGPRAFDETCAAVDPADPSWTVDLGLPTGPVTNRAGVLVRTYTDGLVLLNPSPTTAATVSVDGSYTTADRRTLSGTVTLDARSALLLTRTAS